MTMLKDGVATVTDNGGDSRPTDVALRCVIDDIDDIAASLNSVFYPAKVNRPRNTPQAAAELVATRLERLTIGRVRFGNAVEVHAGDLGCRHVNIRLTGSVLSRTGDQESVASHDHAVLPHWSTDATQICAKIERRCPEQELAQVLARPVDRRVRFDLRMDRGYVPCWSKTTRLVSFSLISSVPGAQSTPLNKTTPWPSPPPITCRCTHRRFIAGRRDVGAQPVVVMGTNAAHPALNVNTSAAPPGATRGDRK